MLSTPEPAFGISLLRVHPARWREVVETAEELGFESVWMSDHLVLPVALDRDAYPEGELPIDPRTPIFDVMVHLALFAGFTSRLRLGTFVYQAALRHPFVAARAVATLDVVSHGRVELGVGAGWSRAEWDAAGVPFERRGVRLDETIDVLRGLWADDAFAFDGEFHRFPPVGFEPKPVQRPGTPVLVGGESTAALRRAVRRGDGWVGMHHTPESVQIPLARLRVALTEAGRTAPLSTTVAAEPGEIDVDAWRATGVSRVIVAPWQRSRDAVDGMRRFARQHLPAPTQS
jgi:probable F420-dependent oxidoreductase